MITTFDLEMADILETNNKEFLGTKKVKKMYFVSKNINDLDVATFQDGDGDCVFC